MAAFFISGSGCCLLAKMRREEFNGKTAQKFLSKIFQKEGSPQVLSGYLRAMRERTLDGGPPLRERSPLPGLL